MVAADRTRIMPSIAELIILAAVSP